MHFARFGALLLLVLVAACGGSDGPAGPGNGNTLLNGSFSAKIDGADFNAIAATVAASSNAVAIGASNGANHGFGMAWIDNGTGTYAIGTQVGTNANYSTTTGGWLAVSTVGSGSITVTTRTANRVAGTFSFVLQPTAGTGATGAKSVTQGSFDLTF